MNTALPEIAPPPTMTSSLTGLANEVIESIAATGGATVMLGRNVPPYLLKADAFQPETYIVGGIAAVREYPSRVLTDPDIVGFILSSYIQSNALSDYSALGFWEHEGVVHVEPSETFTLRTMAEATCAERGELAYYALKAQETVFV